MPKVKTGTTHHCSGATGWVDEHSPGGCTEKTVDTKIGKLYYCTKHSMPCRSGCKNWFHLKNKEECQSCESRWRAEARRERQAREAQKSSENENVDADFWNPGKERKKRKN